MSEEKRKQWLLEFYTEVERLFDGRLPKGFDIANMEVCEYMTPEVAAKDYFIGYHK